MTPYDIGVALSIRTDIHDGGSIVELVMLTPAAATECIKCSD
jgi:hypothetical protein